MKEPLLWEVAAALAAVVGVALGVLVGGCYNQADALAAVVALPLDSVVKADTAALVELRIPEVKPYR